MVRAVLTTDCMPHLTGGSQTQASIVTSVYVSPGLSDRFFFPKDAISVDFVKFPEALNFTVGLSGAEQEQVKSSQLANTQYTKIILKVMGA